MFGQQMRDHVDARRTFARETQNQKNPDDAMMPMNATLRDMAERFSSFVVVVANNPDSSSNHRFTPARRENLLLLLSELAVCLHQFRE